jgi:hypothetical protein
VVAKSLRPAHAYPLGLEPIYAGLAASLLVYAAGWLSRKENAP